MISTETSGPSARGFVGRGALAAILGAGVLVQLAILALGLPGRGRPLFGDERRYLEVARSWAAGGEASLDPLWPPGYPVLLSGWIYLFGEVESFLLLQVALHLAAAILLAGLVTRIAGDERVGALAGLLFVADPQVAFFAQSYWSETVHLGLALATVALVWRSVPSPGGAALAGFAGGVCFLLKSLLGPVVPVLLILFARRAPAGRRLAVGAAGIGAFLVTLAPIVAHNVARHGFWGVSDSFAFNLVLGLTDRSPRSLVDDRAWLLWKRYLASGDEFLERRSAMREEARALVAERGLGGLPGLVAEQLPRQYFRLFDRESFFRAFLPGGTLATQRLGYRSPPGRLASAARWLGHAIYALVLAAAPFGLAALLWRRRPGARAALFWLLACLALFAFLHVKSRYRLAFLPVLELGAATAMIAFVDRFGAEPREAGTAPPWPVIVLSGALSLALLAFGFGVGWVVQR